MLEGDLEAAADAVDVGVRADVAFDERGGVAVRDVGFGLAVEAGGLFDGDAAGAGLAQEVRGDLGVDAGDFDGDFEPGAEAEWGRVG